MVVFCDLFYKFVKPVIEKTNINFLYSKQSLDAPCFYRGFSFEDIFQQPSGSTHLLIQELYPIIYL
jgi:hypothetical protein